MPDRITLTVPLRFTPPPITGYAPERLVIETSPPRLIVKLMGMADEFRYPTIPPVPPLPPTPGATDTDAKTQALITTLLLPAPGTGSLWKRLFTHLVADFPERFVGGASVD